MGFYQGRSNGICEWYIVPKMHQPKLSKQNSKFWRSDDLSVRKETKATTLGHKSTESGPCTDFPSRFHHLTEM